MPTPSPTTNTTTTEPHALKCLEVWGGSSNADHAASVPGLDISVSSRPLTGSESGGDLYLISSCSSGWITRILLADVSGHGSDVSDLSHQLRKAMHNSINTVDQSKLARSLNKSFDTISGGSQFATALLMTYYAPTGHLIFVNAGHPQPLLKKANSPEWIPVNKDTPGVLKVPTSTLRVGIKNLPLGVINSTDYEQIAIKFEAGDRMCAYTDAYTEAKNKDGSLLGTKGLAQILSSIHSVSDTDTARHLLDRLTALGYAHAEDDHTMLMLHHNGTGTKNVGPTTLVNLIKNSFGFGHTDTVVAG